jgi:hypothetical protein
MMRKRLTALVLFVAALPDCAGAHPDQHLTPGTFNPNFSVAAICSTKWGKDARHVTAAIKRRFFQEYGPPGNTTPYGSRTAANSN